ncbi:uncharacterized protein LOC141649721 [Silene latifolia]|uniref:uncharacterized protein LOC141649721 n=1 Tax=Silene latifolia TaxID=37657 RepID=UPI003D77C40F
MAENDEVYAFKHRRQASYSAVVVLPHLPYQQGYQKPPFVLPPRQQALPPDRQKEEIAELKSLIKTLALKKQEYDRHTYAQIGELESQIAQLAAETTFWHAESVLSQGGPELPIVADSLYDSEYEDLSENEASYEDFCDALQRSLDRAKLGTVCVKGLHEIETRGVTRTSTTAYASQVEYAKLSAKYWKQRAKIKWNIEGDTCSKYFFNWVKGRADRNYIAGIKMDNGEWKFDTEDIKGLFVQFYTRLFKEGANQITFDEYLPTVKNLFSINKGFLSPNNKDALGIRFTLKEPVSIPAIFFHKCWHFTKHDVVGTVLAILNGNSSPEFLNKTFLVLIPKTSASEMVDNFRPISLCNVIMKVITRYITNRLKKFMGKLVVNSKSCVSLDKVIKDYCHASGQVINNNKSSMTLSSCCSLSFARKCLKTFNIPCGTNLGSYLGTPTDGGLSGGTLALISPVLSSLSVYFLLVFKIPVSVTKILEAILSHFWWAGHKKSPSISWCSRLFLSQPKGNGGLGIRRTKEFHQALLVKIGWRMITHPDSILSKSIGVTYGLKWRDGDLLFNDGKSNSSWGWKGIVWGLQLSKPLLAWNISPFSDPGVWNTNWVHGTMPKPRCVELLIDSANLCNLRIKDLICNSNCWDHRLVSMSFDETSVNDILAIPIRCSEGSDNFYWSASSSGNYSVKIGYHIALQNSWNTSATAKDR